MTSDQSTDILWTCLRQVTTTVALVLCVFVDSPMPLSLSSPAPIIKPGTVSRLTGGVLDSNEVLKLPVACTSSLSSSRCVVRQQRTTTASNYVKLDAPLVALISHVSDDESEAPSRVLACQCHSKMFPPWKIRLGKNIITDLICFPLIKISPAP